jgi:hypothetical protein
MQAVKLAINETRLVKNLGFAFTNKSTVIAELLQNGRRAGATEIYVEFDGETKTLSVTDNGSGIETMQNLLTVAESGWNEETQIDEHPFGMGFLSALFAAEHVVIESRGKKMAFDTAHALEFGEIAVEMSDFIGGTRITMQGFGLVEAEIQKAMSKYAKGFPLDVYLNGKLQDASLSLVEMSFIKTPIGHIHLKKSQKIMVYLQGLPVFESKNVDEWNFSASIIHLDSKQYFARMPDRDKLIDETEVIKTIQDQIKIEWLKVLQQKKTVMAAEQFAETYWKLAEDFSIKEVMNDVPVIPFIALTEIDQYPDLVYTSYVNTCKKHITQSQVENGEVVLCSDAPCYAEGTSFALTMFIWEKNWKILNKALPESHWAKQYVKDTNGIEAQLIYETKSTGNFYGHYPEATIHLCDQYQIIVNGVAITINDQAIAIEDGDEYTIIVPNNTDGSEALAQISAYEDEYGSYMESAHEDDKSEFASQVSVLRGEDPAITLTKVLQSGGVANYKNLSGGLFMVQVSNNYVAPSVFDATPLMDTIMAAKAFIQQNNENSQESESLLEKLDAALNQWKTMQKEMVIAIVRSSLRLEDISNNELKIFMSDYYMREIECGNHTIATVSSMQEAAYAAFHGDSK